MDASWMSSRSQSQWHVFVRFAQISGTCIGTCIGFLIKSLKTVDGRNTAPPGMYKNQCKYCAKLPTSTASPVIQMYLCLYICSATLTHCCRERFPEFSGGTFGPCPCFKLATETGISLKNPPNKKGFNSGNGWLQRSPERDLFQSRKQKRSKTTPRVCGFARCDFANCPKQQLVDSQKWTLIMMYHDLFKKKRHSDLNLW